MGVVAWGDSIGGGGENFGGLPAAGPDNIYNYIYILYLYHDLFPNCIHLYPVLFP